MCPWGSQQVGVTQTARSRITVLQVGSGSCCWQREMTARGMLCIMAGFWYSPSSLSLGIPLLFCCSWGIRWNFLFVLCLQCSEQSGRKRTVHYSALCPRGVFCLLQKYQQCIREEIWGVVAKSSTLAGKPRAFVSVLIFTRNWVSRINHRVTLNTVIKRIN